MKFVRTLWGNDGRRLKVDKDIVFCLNQKYTVPFVTYCYGENNYRQLVELGLDCKLLSKENRIYPPEQEFGHKLHTWVEAAKDYDKFIFLDWDVALTKPIPYNFEESLKDKQLQVSLRRYFNKKCFWRKEHKRKVPCASWVYFGDNTIPQKLYDIWVSMDKPWREELALAKFTEINNKLDLNQYYATFEPRWFTLLNEGIFKDTDGITLFKHFNTKEIKYWVRKNRATCDTFYQL